MARRIAALSHHFAGLQTIVDMAATLERFYKTQLMQHTIGAAKRQATPPMVFQLPPRESVN